MDATSKLPPDIVEKCERIDSQCMALLQVGLGPLDMAKLLADKAVELVNRDEKKLDVFLYPNRQFSENPIPNAEHILPDITIRARASDGRMWNALILYVAADGFDDKTERGITDEIFLNGTMRTTFSQTDQAIAVSPTSLIFAQYIFYEDGHGSVGISADIGKQELKGMTKELVYTLYHILKYHPHDNTQMRDLMKRYVDKHMGRR